MKILGIRFCSVTKEAQELSDFLEKGLGISRRDMGGDPEVFNGSVFPAGEGSWIEIWKETEAMPAGVMLQIVVDDADAMAKIAMANGIDVMGPNDMHGERVYFAQAPTGLPISFQSKL